MSPFGWSMGETFAVGFFVLLMVGAGVSWVIGLVSKRWADRVSGYVLMVTLVGIVMSLLMWTKPWPVPR